MLPGPGEFFSAQGEFFVVFLQFCDQIWQADNSHKIGKKGRRGDRMVGVGRIDNKKEIPTKSAKAFDLFEEKKCCIFSLSFDKFL